MTNIPPIKLAIKYFQKFNLPTFSNNHPIEKALIGQLSKYPAVGPRKILKPPLPPIKSGIPTATNNKKIKTLIIQTDTLKYESSTLGISQFQDSAKHLADELKRLARMSDIHGQSFTAFSTELAHYQNMLALTEQFINQPTWQLENLSSTQYS